MLVLIPFNVFTFFASPFLFFPFFPILLRFSIYSKSATHRSAVCARERARRVCIGMNMKDTSMDAMNFVFIKLRNAIENVPSHTHINPRKIERKIIHAQHVIIMEKKGIKRFCAKEHEQRAYNFISLDEFCVEMKCGSPVD